MSKQQKEKRPPWWRYGARKEWDGSMKTYREIQARILPKEESEEYDISLPEEWKKGPASFLLRTLGLKKGLPPASGAGLVMSPYADIYTKVYGTVPIADLPKYRTIYRTQPDVQGAVEIQVNLAIGKGFTIKHENKKVVDYLLKVCNDINLLQHMLVMTSDMLVYGNSYTEILWNEKIEKTEQMYEYKGVQYTKDEMEAQKINPKEFKVAQIDYDGQQRNFVAQKIKKGEDARILGLKDLDPIYMRVRRDSWGNIFGYIQWMAFPPVLIDNDSLIHIRFRPKSWGYESAYGTSILMPIIKNNDLLNQLENDCAVWIHSRAVPPLIVKGGTPERPYSTPQMKDLMSILKSRTAASMIFAKADVQFEELKTIASDMDIQWWINYLLTRRYQALGIPPLFMGIAEKGGRATAEVLLHDFITRLQVLQELVADPIEEFIFKPLIKAEFGEDVENAEMVWKPIIEEDRNMRAQRLIQMLQAGAISINESRSEMGFATIPDKPEYDELRPVEPAFTPKGFPPKPGAISKPPAEQKVPETSPEEKLKLEKTEKVKRMQLLQIEDSFREKMLSLVKKIKSDLRVGDKLTKAIKEESLENAKSLINENVVSSYLIGRVKANASLGKEDDLTLRKEDLEPITIMKENFLLDFNRIVEDMVKMKEEGALQ